MKNERSLRNLDSRLTKAARMRAVTTFLTLVCTTGCSRSPELNILGSYFPSWIVCLAVATVLTFVAHTLFTKWKIVEELWPLPLLYSSLICFLSCTLWLILFE
ncbi:MAG: DUF1656 domain-containing protein [Acidobacteriaceae bacterium]|nr:DUF1656 domain-containing protein [Acidobacteriaceae bacterium]